MKKRNERGMTLIELMIAMLVLAIGFGGTTILLSGTIASDNKNSTDTTATLLAQMVMEQISSQSIYSSIPITITDCAGTSWTIAAASGTAGTGNGATLKANGTIDFTQSQSTLLSSNYAMNYVDCATPGALQRTYDVRWNVMSVSTNTTTRFITTAARPAASSVAQMGGAFFTIPVTLQGISGAGVGAGE